MQATDLASKRARVVARSRSQARRSGNPGQCRSPRKSSSLDTRGRNGRSTLQPQDHPVKYAARKILLPLSPLSTTAPQALYVCTDPLTVINRVSINTLASAARLPAIYGVRDLVVAGGLMSYGADFAVEIPSHRRPDRQNSARHEARRYPGRAADQVRLRHQSQDRQGARHQRAADAARARRRGDRMRRRELTSLSPCGAAALGGRTAATARAADNAGHWPVVRRNSGNRCLSAEMRSSRDYPKGVTTKGATSPSSIAGPSCIMIDCRRSRQNWCSARST